MLRLRRNHLALVQDGLEVIINDPARGIVAYHRVAGDQGVVTAVNVSGTRLQLQLPLPSAGRYRTLGGGDLQAGKGMTEVTLEAGEAVVLVGAVR